MIASKFDSEENNRGNKGKTPKKPALKVKRKPRKELFYKDEGTGELAFAPPKLAEYVSTIHNALQASTWGKFKSRMPPKEYKRLLKKVRDGEARQTELPTDDNSPFDPGDWFPEWLDGDYPDWPQQRQVEWLPKSIIKRFAEPAWTPLNGEYWSIKLSSEKDIVKELERMGFKVTRRDDLTF